VNVGCRLQPFAQQAIACRVGGVALQHRHGAQAQGRFARKVGQVEILPDRAGFLPRELVQPRRRRGDAAEHLHRSGGRGHGRQARAFLHVARDPAALHKHGVVALLQTQRCDNEEARPAIHLAVVEVDRALGQPMALQAHRAVMLGGRLFGAASQAARLQRGQA
jgi:hypothetical protein